MARAHKQHFVTGASDEDYEGRGSNIGSKWVLEFGVLLLFCLVFAETCRQRCYVAAWRRGFAPSRVRLRAKEFAA